MGFTLPNKTWEMGRKYHLFCSTLKKLFYRHNNYLMVSYAHDEENKYNFFFIKVIVSDNDISLINDCAKFIIQVAKGWILNSCVIYSYFHVSMDFFNEDKEIPFKKSFPRAIGWWNWFNEELLQNINMEKFKTIPVYKIEGCKYLLDISDKLKEKLNEYTKEANLNRVLRIFSSLNPKAEEAISGWIRYDFI